MIPILKVHWNIQGLKVINKVIYNEKLQKRKTPFHLGFLMLMFFGAMISGLFQGYCELFAQCWSNWRSWFLVCFRDIVSCSTVLERLEENNIEIERLVFILCQEIYL